MAFAESIWHIDTITTNQLNLWGTDTAQDPAGSLPVSSGTRLARSNNKKKPIEICFMKLASKQASGSADGKVKKSKSRKYASTPVIAINLDSTGVNFILEAQVSTFLFF